MDQDGESLESFGKINRVLQNHGEACVLMPAQCANTNSRSSAGGAPFSSRASKPSPVAPSRDMLSLLLAPRAPPSSCDGGVGGGGVAKAPARCWAGSNPPREAGRRGHKYTHSLPAKKLYSKPQTWRSECAQLLTAWARTGALAASRRHATAGAA